MDKFREHSESAPMMRGSIQPQSVIEENHKKGRNNKVGLDNDKKLGGTQKMSSKISENQSKIYSTFGDSSAINERGSLITKSTNFEDF